LPKLRVVLCSTLTVTTLKMVPIVEAVALLMGQADGKRGVQADRAEREGGG